VRMWDSSLACAFRRKKNAAWLATGWIGKIAFGPVRSYLVHPRSAVMLVNEQSDRALVYIVAASKPVVD
jgi:hypothetical protein